MNYLISITLTLALGFTRVGALELSSVSEGERERLELVIRELSSDQARIWPTLNWESAPIVITFENGDIFALNLKSKGKNWETFELLGQKVLFTRNDQWGLLDIQMQPLYEIEGQKAFLYRMTQGESPLRDVAIFAHERFHRHQGENFAMENPQGISLDHLNEENLTWAEIEDQILKDSLAAEGDLRLELLKDFVAVNQMRRASIQEETLLWENGQLRMEGLADYASTKGNGQEALLLAMHPEVDHSDDFIDEAIKWRHYLAGAAIGYSLDFLGVMGWKEQVEKGANLSDLLAQSIPLTKSEQETRLTKIAKRINYKKRRKKMVDRITKYHNTLKALHKDYEARAGISLFVDHPPVSISGGGANDKMIYLEEGGILAINDASVATTADGQWKFETKNVSHLFQHLNGIREVKVEKGLAVQIDELEIEIGHEPREFLFTTLEIHSEEANLKSSGHFGVLILDDSGIHVRY